MLGLLLFLLAWVICVEVDHLVLVQSDPKRLSIVICCIWSYGKIWMVCGVNVDHLVLIFACYPPYTDYDEIIHGL